MGWRSGEIWLETELRWFRERSTAHLASLAVHAPSYLALAAAGVTDVDVPDGLSASRRRRAERRRRRHARRTRAAAALVIAPAAMLTLSGQRLGAGSAGGALQEDPPSMASQRGLPKPAPARPRAVPDEPEPLRIQWRNATSRGLPYSGSLADGTQLPVEAPDWVTWNPAEDRVPNAPHRLYGNERTIRTIVKILTAYRAANPEAPRVVVGDISFRHGGPMDQHVSHQNGLDADIYYPRVDGALRAPGTTAQVDRRLAQDLLDRFVAAGASKIFVGYETDLRGPDAVVIPYPNHENHMHVRLPSRG
jgi:Penicillin-insensitive murein endopeptidase